MSSLRKEKEISLDFTIFIPRAVTQLLEESYNTDETESVLWLENPLRT